MLCKVNKKEVPKRIFPALLNTFIQKGLFLVLAAVVIERESKLH